MFIFPKKYSNYDSSKCLESLQVFTLRVKFYFIAI